MEVGAQIKKYRSSMGISQEELAEKVYVSRQTVSNWETGKNYPDIHSVVLLSTVFNVSLDQLIKGDVEIMKNEIKETEIKKFNKIGGIYAVFFDSNSHYISSVSSVHGLVWADSVEWGVCYRTIFCI